GRCEQPVSVAMARGACEAGTAADDPPDEARGTLARSHGLWLGPNAEFSVEEPMANSSMLVLPRMIAPACLSRIVIVASYGGCQPPRERGAEGGGGALVGETALAATRAAGGGRRSTPPP